MVSKIPAYVISLRDSVQRRRTMAARLDAAGIAFQIVDGLDGRARRIPDWIDGARVVRSGFESEGGLACVATHRLVHRMIVDGDSDLALVFEDDARLPEDFPELLAALAAFDFDVAKFDGGKVRLRAGVGHIGRYSVVVGSTVTMGAAAYLMRRSAAARFCDLPVLDQMTDVAFNDFRLGLRVLQFEPSPVVQDGETPSQSSSNHYGRPIPRKNRLRRFAYSMQRRHMLLRIWGPRIALSLELEKYRKMWVGYSH